MDSMAGKVFCVTGGASGIGFATTKLLACRGAAVSIGDLSESRLSTAAQSIREAGGKNIATYIIDVRDRNSVNNFIIATKREFGRLDGCANIAGVSGKQVTTHNVWELSDSEYKYVMDVNAGGVFNCLAEQLKPGILEEGGSVVNAASFAGIFGMAKSTAYTASKHAVIGLTKVAASEAGTRNIRVNCIAPGIINTPMMQSAESLVHPLTPLSRMGEPEDVASLIAFLLSDESKFITGATYRIDGGWNI